jgi:hypothetical protein
MNSPFEWKRTVFAWSEQRAAFVARFQLAAKDYWLLARETRVGTWESWSEFEGGYTATCVMASRDLALDGTVLALKDHFEKILKDLEPFVPVTPAPAGGFHEHLDRCQRCANQPFNLCPMGASLLSSAAKP